ncbi:MAG: DUF3224 domain-containing protein [Candidatus Korobacteraceae bacterium]
MTPESRTISYIIVTLGVLFALSYSAAAQDSSKTPMPNNKDVLMTAHATGTFEVKVVPQAADDQSKPAAVSRMSIDKQFHGGLDGTSRVEGLTAGTDVKGSAVYVAIEQFTGTLAGHKGTFLLHHTGIMTRGAPHLIVSVVPDSGTGQLVGLTGEMTITIANGKHSYDFAYTLPEAH